MTSFKRWFGAGAIVLVALALIACPAMLPTVAKEIGDITFGAGDIGKTKTVSSLGGYFNARDDATYDASSSDVKVATATASVADATLTVTAKGPGTANVTVTATDRDGTVEQTFSVTVDEPKADPPVDPPVDPPSNKPPEVRTFISDLPLQVADTKTLTLSNFYRDPEGDELAYTSDSSDHAIATVTNPDDATSMITITAVAAGTATITVTAKDDTNAAVAQMFDVTVTATPPVVEPNERPTSDPIAPVSLRVGETKTVTLSVSYRDRDDDNLRYTAVSGNEAVATVTNPDDATSMITITAVAAGTAMITVTATDDKSDPLPETITVTVKKKLNAAPTVLTGISRSVPLTVGVDGQSMMTLDVSLYFDDAEGDGLTYTPASSDMPMIATVTGPDAGSMITITAVAAGTAKITVTASDAMSNDGDANPAAVLDLTVTVSAMPPEPNNPPTLVPDMTAPTVSLELDDEPETLNVSIYFSDPDGDDLTFEAMSSDPGKATESVFGSMVTITALAAGTATITVTALDDEAESAALEIPVTIRAPGNLKPTVIGDGIRDIKMVVKGTQDVDFSKYFDDTDSPQLFYSVTEVDDNATDDVIMLNPDLDGTNFDTKVVITAIVVGKATVTVTATDFGNKVATDSFTVTVIAIADNADPKAVENAVIVDVDGAPATTRLTVGGDKTVIDGKIKGYFDDANFVASGQKGSRESGETLTFSVEYFEKSFTAGDKKDSDLVAAAKNKLDPDADADAITVSADVSPKKWNGDTNSTFTLTLTGLKASTLVDKKAVVAHAVALIATDEYGRRAAQVFHVRVNHKPKAGGNEGTLSALKKYYDPPIQVHTSSGFKAYEVKLENYFSDGDGDNDIVSCRRTEAPATDNVATIEWTSATTFTILPKADGTMRVIVDCLDAANERSEPDTLLIAVEGGTFSQR